MNAALPSLLSMTHGFPEGQIVGFALVLLRMIAFVVAMPIFGTSSVPGPVKVLFPMVLTLLLYPFALRTAGSDLAISEMVLLWAVRELAIGLFLGFLVRMFFFAVSVAGDLIGVSSGLSAAQIFNPAMGVNSSIMEQFQVLIATVLFLALNGHHFFIEGIAHSFETLPIGLVGVRMESFGIVGSIVTDVTVSGLKIASPIVVSIFMTNLTLAILGKAVPQINVWVTSLQVTIVVALAVMIISIPTTTETMSELLLQMGSQFMRAMKAL